ncbi:hypothetical protein SH528x_002170 [Novipirellula sp. SH528]|uniref:hypothetical protein n=1 Tax=Novipirellula sp. SH528 TaxID=3454466 RepID=UPI003FA14C6A
MAHGFTIEPDVPVFGSSHIPVEDTGDEKQFYERIRTGLSEAVSNLPRVILHGSNAMAKHKDALLEHALENAHSKGASDTLAPTLASLLQHADFVLNSSDTATRDKFLESLAAEVDAARILEVLKQAVSNRVEASFVEQAQELDRIGETDRALDVVFDAIDDAFLDGKFGEVDQALDCFEIAKCSVGLLVGILTVTAAAESKLKRRKKFRDLVETSIRNRGRYDERLLRDL